RVDGDRHRGRVVQVKQQVPVEVGVALVGHAAGEVVAVGRVVGAEDAVEVRADGLQVDVVAQVGQAVRGRLVGRRRGQQEVVPAGGVGGAAQVRLPAVGGGDDARRHVAGQVLVEEPDRAGAVDRQRRVQRVGDGQQVVGGPGLAGVGGAAHVQRVVVG